MGKWKTPRIISQAHSCHFPPFPLNFDPYPLQEPVLTLSTPEKGQTSHGNGLVKKRDVFLPYLGSTCRCVLGHVSWK